MKRENLEIGKKVKIIKMHADFNGALYEGDVVTISDFTTVSDKKSNVCIVYVEDIHGRHHSLSLDDIDDIV